MRLAKNLNLVIPVEMEGGVTAYVHSTPISRETFEGAFLLIAKTFATIHQNGLGVIAGPRVAALILQQTALNMGMEEKGVQLMNEIRRLSNVLTPGTGDTMVPLQEAVTRGVLSDEDRSEVENALAFFTVCSAMHRREEREMILREAMLLWGGQLGSWGCTEFLSSLPTLTGDENTGETAVVSAVPS